MFYYSLLLLPPTTVTVFLTVTGYPKYSLPHIFQTLKKPPLFYLFQNRFLDRQYDNLSGELKVALEENVSLLPSTNKPFNSSNTWLQHSHVPPLCSSDPSTSSRLPLCKRRHLWRGCQVSLLAAPSHNPPPGRPSASAPWWWTVSEGP